MGCFGLDLKHPCAEQLSFLLTMSAAVSAVLMAQPDVFSAVRLDSSVLAWTLKFHRAKTCIVCGVIQAALKCARLHSSCLLLAQNLSSKVT